MTILAAALFAPVTSPASAQLEQRGAAPGSKLWIEGGSNVRDWSCTATTFEARVDLDSAHAMSDAAVGADQVKRIAVKVSVRDLKCGNSHMETDLYRALKADDPATPSYIIGVFDALRAPDQGDSHVDTEGTIAVAGVEKGVRLRVTLDRLSDGSVVARGSAPLLMTDFGVKPPTGLLGLIRSKNAIVVKFEVVISAQTRPAQGY
jgi:polyisoprenoid-binding protein YceI